MGDSHIAHRDGQSAELPDVLHAQAGSLPFSIARTWKIRGIVAPHFVMQTSDGAVAILLLSKERMLTPEWNN